MECDRCGQEKWYLVFRDCKVVEDDGKGTQKYTGVLVGAKCYYCDTYLGRKLGD